MPNEIAMPQQAGRGAVERDDVELDQLRGGAVFDPFLLLGGVKAPGPRGGTEIPGTRTGATPLRMPIGS